MTFDLDNEMERIGRIVAADQGLTVNVRGVQAFASAGQVTVPNIEHFSWLGTSARRMLHGLLDHECGHASFTDFDALGVWLASGRVTAQIKRLANIVEDGYVERMQGARYPGSAQNISKMNEWFYADTGDDGQDIMSFIATASTPEQLWRAFGTALGTVLTPHGHRSIEFYAFAPRVQVMLLRVADEIRVAQAVDTPKRTAENIAIAERIYAQFAHAPVPKEPDKGKPAEGEGEGKPAEGKPAEGEGEGKPAEGEGEGKPAEGKPAEGEGEGKPAEGEGEVAEGKPEFFDLDRYTTESTGATAAIDARLRNMFEQPRETQPYVVFDHQFDAFRDFSSEDRRKHAAAFLALCDSVRAVSSNLVLCFEAALRASGDVAPTGGSDEGEIDPMLLTEYAVGAVPADQLYVHYVESDAKDVAVEILCDCSGSMRGTKAVLCREAAIALHLALDQAEIKHEISGFTTLEASVVINHPWTSGCRAKYEDLLRRHGAALHEAARAGTCIENFARDVLYYSGTNTAFHAVFKGFDSVDASGLLEIAGIANNLDGEAVLWAAQRLAARPEKRRVLFVLSDGYPAGSRDNAQGSAHLHDAVRRSMSAGIEVYGLGMLSDAVGEFYPHSWTCSDLHDLGALALGGLSEVLTKNRIERTQVALR